MIDIREKAVTLLSQLTAGDKAALKRYLNSGQTGCYREFVPSVYHDIFVDELKDLLNAEGC